jgi:hypothetical protein
MKLKKSTGQKIVLQQINDVCFSKTETRQKRLMALLLCRIKKLNKKQFYKQLKSIYESESIEGPLAVAWGMNMMAIQTEPGQDRIFFLNEMDKCKADAHLMKKIKKGWVQYNVVDPWWVVHHKPEKQMARYNSEPIIKIN